jgi:Raf kinase inhibitor-like YbhB/YbcL family protein
MESSATSGTVVLGGTHGISTDRGRLYQWRQHPQLHTCDGADLSPALEWSGEPSDTQSFALIMDDPDAPAGTWNHWLLYALSASEHALAQGYKPDHLGVSGKNDFGKLGYGGPCRPKGHRRIAISSSSMR